MTWLMLGFAWYAAGLSGTALAFDLAWPADADIGAFEIAIGAVLALFGPINIVAGLAAVWIWRRWR